MMLQRAEAEIQADQSFMMADDDDMADEFGELGEEGTRMQAMVIWMDLFLLALFHQLPYKLASVHPSLSLRSNRLRI